MSRDVRSFDYVNHPYPAVRDALTAQATTVFSGATTAATSRAASVAAELKVNLGALKVTAPIELTVGTPHESDGPGGARRLVVPIAWKAAERAGLFPVMNAELVVYPLTSTETQLEFAGSYDPPLGVLGSALDATVGYRVAEASVHRFVTDVAQYLRQTLG